MLILTEIIWALQLAVVAYVVTCILMTQDHILEPYLDLLLKLENTGKTGKWLAQPLGLCEKCTAGQIALWVWLYFNYSEYLKTIAFAFLRHCIFISFTILFVTVIKNIFSKWH